MYDFFKQIAQRNYCLSNGVCSIHPSVTSLYELLLNEAREISNYIVKLKEFKITTEEYTGFIVEVLSTRLINTSFSENDYLKVIKKLHEYKIKTKDKYLEYCRLKGLPCEIINTDFKLDNSTTISELIKFSQENITNRQKGCDRKKAELFELIATYARLCAINIVKIKKIKPEFSEYDFELLRFFALTNGYSIRNEKIIRRIKEFSTVALSIRKKLSDLLEIKYGSAENTKIDIYAKKGHCILVSGEDFDELENILNAVEESKYDINVYTNGELFLAHFYPYFKNNNFLKGHWGKNETEYDFSTFPGSIFMTQNFNGKIDNLYKGELFSSKLISFNKISNIRNKDYMPVINSAVKLEGFIKNDKEETYIAEYKNKKIYETIDELNSGELIIIAGNKNFQTEEKYKEKHVVTLNFSYDAGILVDIIKKCREKNIKPVIFFMECNKTSLESLFILTNYEVETAFADCSYILINPNVISCLKNDFNVKII